MLCEICQNVLRLLKPEPDDFGAPKAWVDRDGLSESAKQCEFCAVFSELLPAEQPHEHRWIFGGRVGLVSDREINVRAGQKLSDDGNSYNVELEFTRHTHTTSPLTLANVIICNNTEAMRKNFQQEVSVPSSPDRLIKFILQRLHECIHHHHMCKKRFSPPQKPELPKRLLDVGCGKGSQVQLVETSGGSDCYVALSHRWGAISKPQILEFHHKLKAGLPSEDLPKTFQHAIHFTRRLGVKYLWIDSFCIIQDSAKDWEEQAPKMASVYQGALCTISAAASRDSYGGLYDLEEPKTYKEFEHGDRKLVAYCHAGYKAIEQSSLNTRAWVLQEWILSPRLVHFTKDGVFWECISHVASENQDTDFYFTHIQDQFFAKEEERIFPVMARAAVAGSSHTWQSLYEIWARLVEDYASRDMTIREDKFAALAGLTTAFQGRLQDVSIAGLWRADFHMGLLWSVESYSSIDTIYLDHNRYQAPEWKPAMPGIPSWSWASVDGPIHYNIHREARFVNDLQLNDAQVDWETEYRSRGGRISGKGIVRRFHVTYRGAHDCDLCFDTQPGGPSAIMQARSPLYSKLRQSPQDVFTAMEKNKRLDGEIRDVPEIFLVREMLLSMPPFVGQIREVMEHCEIRMAEHEMSKPLDFLHGRGSLDRPQIPMEGSKDCELHALLVATELRPDGDIGGGIIPYANHVLFLEKTDVQGEFRRIGVGIFWARHGYFERIQSQNLVIC